MANGNTKDRPAKRLREWARVAYQAEALFTPERLLAVGKVGGALDLAPGRSPLDLVAAGAAAGRAAGRAAERNRTQASKVIAPMKAKRAADSATRRKAVARLLRAGWGVKEIVDQGYGRNLVQEVRRTLPGGLR